MPTDKLLDLEAAVKAWARQEYDDIADRKQKKLRRKEQAKGQSYIHLSVDWSEVVFDDKPIEFPVIPYGGVNSTVTAGQRNPDRCVHSAAVRSGLADVARPSASVLFRTKFKNMTDREQEYTMRTERTTRSTLSTEVESAYTRGFDMSVTLKTPSEMLELNAGYHREYSLNHVTGQSFEEELHWGVDSVIKVKKNHVANASLVVYEQKGSGHFSVETEISGRVYVTFTNIRDNNSFIMATSEDICTILEDYVREQRINGKSLDFVRFDSKVGKVYVMTSGKCQFQFGVRQEVLVDQQPLDDATAAEHNEPSTDDDLDNI